MPFSHLLELGFASLVGLETMMTCSVNRNPTRFPS
jgi:hypothetical protein